MYYANGLGQDEPLPPEQNKPPFVGELADGSPCLKSPEWDLLPTCEAKWEEWKKAAGNCAVAYAAFDKPGCMDKLTALNESFEWGSELCQGLAMARSMAEAETDPAAKTALESQLNMMNSLPSCEGKVREAPVEIIEEESKSNTTLYLSLAIAAVGIGALVGIAALTVRKG